MNSLKERMSKIVLCQSTMAVDIASSQFSVQKKNKTKVKTKSKTNGKGFHGETKNLIGKNVGFFT